MSRDSSQQLCTAVQPEVLPSQSRVARCNRDQHVLTSLHSISSPVFVSSLCTVKNVSHPCWTAVKQTCKLQLTGGWNESEGRRESHSLPSVLCLCACTPHFALRRNLFRHVLRYVIKHMLKLSNLRNFSFCCNLQSYHRNSCSC